MNRPHRFLRAAASIALAFVFVGLAGCAQPPDKPKPPRYAIRGKRSVPAFMEGTIYQITDLGNDQPFLVSGWGLVVNLDGTGGSRQLSNNVKAYMMMEMERKGFGSKLIDEYKNLAPEQIIADRNTAIVGVYGWLPPAARKGQWFDIAIKAAADDTTSLAHGTLYDTELAIDGANPINPRGRVNIWGTAYGPVFVNPAVALNVSQNPDGATKRSLRTGAIIGGGQVLNDRPLLLQLREPERRMARNIEFRINDAFHQDHVCTAFDEGYCQLWLPNRYSDDWAHFARLVEHVYLQGGSEAFARAKARQLVEEARKPGAQLQDISYCWEGLGQYALAELAPLMTDEREDVRFAAARAAAYIGDPSGAAERTLYDIARADQSPCQVAAVQVLGKVPNSRAINQLLRDLLGSKQTTVRVEAYNILARAGDPSISRQVIRSASQPIDQKFLLDYVHCGGQPLIYATRSGVPRIAIFGNVPELSIPVTFSALDNHLMISSGAVGRDVTIFYRNARLREPIQMSSPPDVADILGRLAGQMDDGTGQLDFTYAEIVAILQGMTEQQKLRVIAPTGEALAAAFLLQEDTSLRDVIDSAPSIERGRPQGETEAPRLDTPPAPAGETPAPADRVGRAVGPANDDNAVAGRQ